MEHLGVIVAVCDPNDWVSSIVMVTKPNGSLRVCKAIKQEYFPMPMVEVIAAQVLRYFQFSTPVQVFGKFH